MSLAAPFIEDQEEEKYASVHPVSGHGRKIFRGRAVGVSLWHGGGRLDTPWIPAKRTRVPEIISWSQTDEVIRLTEDAVLARKAAERKTAELELGAYRILRLGILLLVGLVPLGVALLSLAGPVGSALGFSFLYAGVLVVLVTQYAFGLKTGHFAISPRYSVLGIIAFVGLIVTSFVAAIERLS